jgi:hypothetical protein
LEGPSKGAPLKICNEDVPYYEIEYLQQTLIKMTAAKLTHLEIKEQRSIRGEYPHLSPSNGVECGEPIWFSNRISKMFGIQ